MTPVPPGMGGGGGERGILRISSDRDGGRIFGGEGKIWQVFFRVA